MTQFYVMQGTRKLGPLTREQVIQKLKGNQIPWTAYFVEEGQLIWKVILEDEYFLAAFKVLHPSPQFRSEDRVTNEYLETLFQTKNWFAMRGSEQIGPYSYLEIVKMLQTKKIHEYEYVWCPRFSNWQKISSLEEFTSERIRALRDSGLSEVKEVFFRRRFPRANLNASILVHNNKEVWKGTTSEVGPGGAGFELESATLGIGQNIFIHLKATEEELPSFNAIATVVSQFEGQDQKVKYGVAFTKISQSVQQAILSFAEKANSRTEEIRNVAA